MTDPFTLRQPAELSGILAGRSDDEIAAHIMELGLNDVLRAVFDGMADGYRPQAGPSERSVVQWEIQDPRYGVHVWQMAATRQDLTIWPDVAEDPDLTLRLGLVPFLRMMTRELRGLEVLCSGIVKVKGSLRLAVEMESWFPDPEPAP